MGLLSRTLALALAASGLACAPELAQDLSLVDEPRVLAVESVPAEAPPGAAVRLRALYVDGDGTLDDGALAWSWCTAIPERLRSFRGWKQVAC